MNKQQAPRRSLAYFKKEIAYTGYFRDGTGVFHAFPIIDGVIEREKGLGRALLEDSTVPDQDFIFDTKDTPKFKSLHPEIQQVIVEFDTAIREAKLV